MRVTETGHTRLPEKAFVCGEGEKRGVVLEDNTTSRKKPMVCLDVMPARAVFSPDLQLGVSGLYHHNPSLAYTVIAKLIGAEYRISLASSREVVITTRAWSGQVLLTRGGRKNNYLNTSIHPCTM